MNYGIASGRVIVKKPTFNMGIKYPIKLNNIKLNIDVSQTL